MTQLPYLYMPHVDICDTSLHTNIGTIPWKAIIDFTIEVSFNYEKITLLVVRKDQSDLAVISYISLLNKMMNLMLYAHLL